MSNFEISEKDQKSQESENWFLRALILKPLGKSISLWVDEAP